MRWNGCLGYISNGASRLSVRKILVFGNSLYSPDSLAFRVADILRQDSTSFEFIECDSAENLEKHGPDLLILDVAKGIDKVTVLDDLTVLESAPSYSMHDFDLALSLKLLKKLGKIRSVRIIALPMGMDAKHAAEEAKSFLTSN